MQNSIMHIEKLTIEERYSDVVVSRIREAFTDNPNDCSRDDDIALLSREEAFDLIIKYNGYGNGSLLRTWYQGSLGKKPTPVWTLSIGLTENEPGVTVSASTDFEDIESFVVKYFHLWSKQTMSLGIKLKGEDLGLRMWTVINDNMSIDTCLSHLHLGKKSLVDRFLDILE